MAPVGLMAHVECWVRVRARVRLRAKRKLVLWLVLEEHYDYGWRDPDVGCLL